MATALRIVHLATQAGLDVADLPNISPWAPQLRLTPQLELLQAAILERDPQLAEELQAAAGIQGQPSLRLAAALHQRQVAEANGWPVAPLSSDLQSEWDRLNPAAAAARRQAAEQALLESWQLGAEQMAQTSRLTVWDSPEFCQQLEAGKRQAAVGAARAAAGL